MSIYRIEIDETSVIKQVQYIIDEIVREEIRHKYGRKGSTADAMTVFVKEMVYAHKDEIIEKIVDRASREMVRKGMAKLIQRLEVDDGK